MVSLLLKSLPGYIILQLPAHYGIHYTMFAESRQVWAGSLETEVWKSRDGGLIRCGRLFRRKSVRITGQVFQEKEKCPANPSTLGHLPEEWQSI